MKSQVLVLLLAAVAIDVARADLKPDFVECDAKKATRNAAMDATIGVSGRCDPEKVVKNSKENLADDARDAVDIDNKKHKHKNEKRRKNKD